MRRVVIWHYNRYLREAVQGEFQRARCLAYAAPTVQAALEATLALRPDVVLTDYPALLDDGVTGEITLTEAIRARPEFDDVVILNVIDPATTRSGRGVPEVAGVSGTVPGTLPARRIVAAVNEIARRRSC